ncbi:hypothetical protein [Nocardia abscessus]|uniref:hypothetical protein n=1 Tax=Nocardia abscessus TaxID=120957 RepID=UPI0005BD97A6|nr:hypothetical protein [Nocardia abscessus]MCC3332082.1 phosphatidylinositol 4-kinase [Nocardia abscessus]
MKAGVHALDNADGHGRHLIEDAGTLRQPHPMQVPPLSRDWNYRPSALESVMAARRMVTEVEFTGDMRKDVKRGTSAKSMRKMRSDDGQLDIYKPTKGEKRAGLPFINAPGALTSRVIAAYRVDEVLGFGRIPTTASTEDSIDADGRRSGDGMIRQFVDSTADVANVGACPRVQRQQVAFLDYIIGALDRHRRNYRTVDRGTHLVLVAIDHGLSFPMAAHP